MPPPSHVVIIGAGITGALVAHRLLQSGIRVTVLEARQTGAGSSSRSAACLRQQFSTPDTVRAMVWSTRFFKEFGQRMGCEGEAGRVLVQNGYLFLYDRPELHEAPAEHAARWEVAQANLAMQRQTGLADVELLAPEQVGERFPQVDASRLIGATFCPSDGFLHPDLVYSEGFRRVRELGGELHQNQEVVGATAEGARLLSVHTAQGDVFSADLFVNATNAWAPRVSQLLGASELPIEPIKRYLYFLKGGPTAEAGQLLSWPMTITARRAYCRPENAAQLLAGWAHAGRPEPDFTWDDQDVIEPPYFHKSGLDNYGYQLWMQLAEALPPTGEFAGIEATTGGFYAVTPDHNPLLGYDLRLGNLVHAAGFSGHGAMMGPFTGEAINALVVGGPDVRSVQVDGAAIDLAAFSLKRRFEHAERMVI
jgi:sarcosine oxidase subunit beta